MSLVNDALRRAQDAQKKSQMVAPGPQFRPAERVSEEKRGMGIWVPIAIAAVAVAGLILVWQNRQKAEARQPIVEPKPAAPLAAIPEAKPPVQPAEPAPAPVATVAVAEKPVPAPAVVAPAPAPAPTLKLQAIFYSPGHSSAMINGKTVRVGDNFRGFRIAALTQTSATLVSATQTNVMTLEQD